jgi:hypothetical protein
MTEPIDTAETGTPSHTRYYLIAGGVGFLIVIMYLIFGGSAPPPPPPTKQRSDDPVRTSREALSRSADLTTIREVLTQINQLLGRQEAAEVARPVFAPPNEILRRQFELSNDEWAELTSESFTLLDGHHLETSFIFRDAAASFTYDGALDDAPSLRRAELAFDWAVRQVSLPEGRDLETDPLPLDFVVRRGRGTAIERALVFLALLQQLDLPGCLIAKREPLATSFPLWACGVLIDRDIYLFDPRVGIPLPGPKGNGVATLAEAVGQPEVLKQLEADGYDVTSEQARKARLYVALPMSALAPRMEYLEKMLQDKDVTAPVVSVRLSAAVPGLFKRLQDAWVDAGVKDPPSVQAWSTAARTARSVLPPEEGGIDKSPRPRWSMLRFSIVPLQNFPPIVSRDMGFMYQKLVEKFSSPFINLIFEPHQPRDSLLRGRFDDASRILTTLRTEADANVARMQGNPEMPRRAAAAVKKIQEAQGAVMIAQNQGNPNVDDLREELDRALREGQGWVDAYIDGSAGIPLGEEVSFQLALSKHEQAVRMQLRVEFPNRSGSSTGNEAEEARRAWLNAADWWKTYLDKYADSAGSSSARLHAGRARLMLGERDGALELLRDHSKLTDLEKVGRAILVRQIEKK